MICIQKLNASVSKMIIFTLEPEIKVIVDKV